MPDNGDVVWVVGRSYGSIKRGPKKGVSWGIMGVFDTEEKAREACITPWYFCGPTKLNEKWAHDREPWPGAYYPLADEIDQWTLEEIEEGKRNAR